MTDGQQVAIKFERRRAAQPQLEYESKVYKALSGGIGIPQTRYFGKEGEHDMICGVPCKNTIIKINNKRVKVISIRIMSGFY
jgi:predicted Ser/Thr protein kinase